MFRSRSGCSTRNNSDGRGPPETDILGAERAGLKSALVLTGTTSPEDARASAIQADETFDSLAALGEAWAARLRQTV
jgi:hypothetical protein